MTALRVQPVGAMVFPPAARYPPSCGPQPWQSGVVVGSHWQNEAGPYPLNAAISGLGHVAYGLCPGQSLFDPLAVLDRPGIALMSGGAAVDR